MRRRLAADINDGGASVSELGFELRRFLAVDGTLHTPQMGYWS